MDYLIRLESRNSFTIIKWIDEQPSSEYHLFRHGDGRWSCSCPDSLYRGGVCKHQKMIKQCIAKGTPHPFMAEA